MIIEYGGRLYLETAEEPGSSGLRLLCYHARTAGHDGVPGVALLLATGWQLVEVAEEVQCIVELLSCYPAWLR